LKNGLSPKIEEYSTIRMSLYHTLLDEATDFGTNPKGVVVWDWVRSNLNFQKFRSRAAYSRRPENHHTEVKVVLMEYATTHKTGDSVTYHYVPNTKISTNCLQRDNAVKDYLHYMIADRDPSVQVYTRRKIVNDAPHEHLRQLVVKFNVNHAVPPPIEHMDEETHPSVLGPDID